MQKQIADNNVRVSDSHFPEKETVDFGDFLKFLDLAGISLKSQFSPIQIETCFSQLAERKQYMEKAQLMKLLKNEREQVAQEWLPFIANEFLYHIINNGINIYKVGLNPSAKKLTVAQFEQFVVDKVKYRPTNPKDMPSLFEFFALEG